MGSSCSCPDSEVVDLVLDGEAEPAQRADYDKHLAECGECRRRHEFYSQLRSTIRTTCSQESCPELVKARLLKVLGQEVQTPVASAAKRPSIWGLGWLAAASAAVFSFAVFRPNVEKATPLALSLSQDHSRCCTVPAAGTAISPASLAHKTYGAAMPEMPEVQNLEPYDVRLCPVLEGERVIHVLCRDQRQRIVSMYAMPVRQDDLPSSGAEPRVYDTHDARVAAWQHKGWMFSLVSEAAGEELVTLAGNCDYQVPGGARYARPEGLPEQVPAYGPGMPGGVRLPSYQQTPGVQLLNR